MIKEWKYSIALIVTFIGMVLFQLYGPKGIDWKHSFSKEDKIPYGNYILYSRLKDIFPNKNLYPVTRTLFEITDTILKPTNYIFINESFNISKPDMNKLFEFVSKGNNVFIASKELNKKLTDTLSIKQIDKYFLYTKNSSKFERLPDSIWLKIYEGKKYYFKNDAINSYFEISDSSEASVIGKNQFGDPTLISAPFGKGKFLLSSTPLVYSNFYMLHDNNAEFIAQTLSELPVQNVVWDEYYMKSRRNTDTPLRFILDQESLKWAFYILLISILLFMLFEAKRRQRTIPIIKTPANESLDFIKTIGQLYLHSNNATIAAINKINYFSESIRRKYLIRTSNMDLTFIDILSQKSGVEKELVNDLISLINSIQKLDYTNEEQLIRLNQLIKRFQKNSK